MQKKWIMPNYSEEDKINLDKLKKSPELMSLSSNAIDILYNRGIRTVEEIEKHLYSTINDMYPSLLLKDCDKFVEIVSLAIKNGDEIVNYTDYDMDGIGSAVICINGLKKLGAKINYYTNNRFIEGYGITPAGVDDLMVKFPDTKLLITTDNGILGYEGIKRAKEKYGLTVIVTDHHQPGETLPDADAIINPHRKDCKYPFKGLCGAGVIFKLLLQLYWDLNEDLNYMYNMIDILAIATVGDMVPMVDENRIFVREGIKKLMNSTNITLEYLRKRLEVNLIDEETIGFQYTPMFNALGRIDGSPDDAIDLLTIDDIIKKQTIVNKMIGLNDYRKELQKTQEEEAIQIVEAKGIRNFIVITADDFHEGIIGLIAGKIKDKYNRPTIILAPHEKTITNPDGSTETKIIYKGSGRSIEGYHLFDALGRVKEHIISFGGHAAAAGVSLDKSELINFEEAINKDIDSMLKEEDYTKNIMIDTSISANDISIDFIESFHKLKPFGMNFGKPKFGLKDFIVDINNTSDKYGKFSPYMGKEEKVHLKLINNNHLSVISFFNADKYKSLGEPKAIKAVGFPKINVYNGKSSCQFMIENDYFVVDKQKK